MASAIHGFRLVRCPKCSNVLRESADIPVYACGGCGKILRAKYSFTGENVGTVQSNSSTEPSSDALDNRLPSSLTERTPCSTGMENGVKEALVDDQPSTQPHTLGNCPVKIESLEQTENSVDGKDNVMHTLKPESSLAAKRNGEDLSNVDTDYMLESKEDVIFKPEFERSPKLHLLGHDILNVSDRRLDSTESNSPYFASDEDTIFHSIGHGNSWRSTMSKSVTYDKKLSVDNYHARDGASSSSDSDISNANKAVGEHLVVNEKTVVDQTGLQADFLQAKSPNNIYELAVTSTFDTSKYKFHTRKDTSLGSADFHSVQNWFEPESDGPLRSPVRDEVLNEDLRIGKKGSSPSELKSLEHVQVEILRKVDELKCEISDLFHSSLEKTDGSHLGGTIDNHQRFDLVHDQFEAQNQRETFQQQCKFAQIASLLPPGTCLHCLHEECEKPPKTSRNITCSDGFCRVCSSTPSNSYNKVQQHDHDVKESDHKGKKKQPKHHCRPVLGGAPFIVCYNCLKLLQLPLDFLVANKQFYRLQCGACAKILKFSFRNRYCSITQLPIQGTSSDTKHPPSEADNNNDSVPELEISQSEDNQQQDHLFYSEEDALPFVLGYLANNEPQLHVPRNSSSSLELKNGRLHRLMGYGSASQLIYQHSDSDEGFESSSISEDGYVRNALKGKEIYVPQESARKQSRFHQNSR